MAAVETGFILKPGWYFDPIWGEHRMADKDFPTQSEGVIFRVLWRLSQSTLWKSN